jgi:hypothetical protein
MRPLLKLTKATLNSKGIKGTEFKIKATLCEALKFVNKSRVAVPSFLSLAISEERSSNSKEVSVKASEAKATDNTLNLCWTLFKLRPWLIRSARGSLGFVVVGLVSIAEANCTKRPEVKTHAPIIM